LSHPYCQAPRAGNFRRRVVKTKGGGRVGNLENLEKLFSTHAVRKAREDHTLDPVWDGRTKEDDF